MLYKSNIHPIKFIIMTTGQKFLGGIMLGVAAGVAIALFINSDKGKEILSDVTDAAGDVTNKLKNKVGDVTDSLKNKLSDYEDDFKNVLKKGKSLIKDIESTVKDFTG